jgi:hypothetical protein
MYCTNCDCEFDGWLGKCPNCKNQLQEEKPINRLNEIELIDYDSIVKSIRDNGGSLEITVNASEVGKTKSLRFPYAGFGYAWTKRMQGTRDGLGVDLSTTKVGKDRKRGFPYLGYGYAWQQEMEGFIGGHDFCLVAKKITKKKNWGFPYRGFGYAWTEEMAGELGDQIKISIKSSQVNKKRGWQFPYFGFGFAWVKEAELSLSLI